MSRFMIGGPGAVGVALGWALEKSGHEVRFFGRGGAVAVRATLTACGAPHRLAFPAMESGSRPDAVFFCVKAGQLRDALCLADRLVHDDATFVVLCNGVVEEVIHQWVKSERVPGRPQRTVRLGTCTVGVTKTETNAQSVSDPEFVIRSTQGTWSWGALLPAEGKAADWEKDLFGSRFFSWAQDVRSLVRTKWLINTVINSIAGAHRLPANGAMLAMAEIVDGTFAEALRLGTELWGPWTTPDEELKALIWSVIRDTAENENSLARDVRLGRETESPWFAGLAAGRQGYDRLHEWHQRIQSMADVICL